MKPEIIENLIAQGRDGYEARLAAGQARLKSGDVEQAITHLERASEFRPDQTMAWQELGRARLEHGDVSGARSAWSRGLQVAAANGDKQAEKVMAVWLKRLDRSAT
ncbi:MAG: tetratricopeptide repeat protein [Wenzhouxiangella sp.]|jgi:Flp pilus assembly protein TadD|nr:tetratricopeptide repeat protein [Wenzhouxiangella sp.]